MIDTPIFNQVKSEQGLDWPRPAPESHDSFLVRHEYPEFMHRAEMILHGLEIKSDVKVKKQKVK